MVYFSFMKVDKATAGFSLNQPRSSVDQWSKLGSYLMSNLASAVISDVYHRKAMSRRQARSLADFSFIEKITEQIEGAVIQIGLPLEESKSDLERWVKADINDVHGVILCGHLLNFTVLTYPVSKRPSPQPDRDLIHRLKMQTAHKSTAIAQSTLLTILRRGTRVFF